MRHIPDILTGLRERAPLIHCITNPISINQCANAILALGGRPIMAEHPREVEEITATASALMLNLGNITDVRMDAMRLAARTAAERGIPILLDAVGVACSQLRRDYVCELLSDVTPTVIKGNYSEINALCCADYRASGVDADGALDTPSMDRAAAALAHRHGAVLLASGRVDVITDGTRLVHSKNGTPRLSGVTGTGCMLGALTAACLSVSPDMDGAAAACAVLGICGQLAETERGSGSFMVGLLDALSTVDGAVIERYLDREEITIEAS